MSEFMTHIAAIFIGVGLTLYIVNSRKGKEFHEHATVSSSVPVPPVEEAGSSGATKKKQNKKKTKNKKTATARSVTPPPPAAFNATPSIPSKKEVAEAHAEEAAAALLAEEDEKPTKATTTAASTGGKKKKNKKKKNKPNAAAATTNGSSTPAPTVNKVPTSTAAPISVPFQPRVVVEEEAWATIPVQKKKKKRVKALSPTRTDAADKAAATAPVPKETVTIDANRVGIIIGPKGETMNKIQERAGVKLDVNAPAKPEEPVRSQFRPVVGGRNNKNKVTATVIITEGTPEGRTLAKQAILELASRGFATLLQAESFGEATVSVHPKYLHELIGTKGKIIRAIEDTLGVKLTIPKTDWNPKTVQIGNQVPTCRVGIAGDDPKQVKLAKQVIKDICNYHYHEITHPGMSHQEVYVPQEFFHCVIGPRGSEIKHIRGNYHVEVYMPSSESVSENVVCVGRPNDVEKSIAYIKLLMERDNELREQKYSDEGYGDDSAGW